MTRVQIVTDSTADIPVQQRKALGIEMVPLKVHINGETFLDDVTITADQFYDKLKTIQNLPTTSQPSPVDFMETFKAIVEREPGTQIVCICLSSALSGTYQSALLAASMLEGKVDIAVVDSKSASYGIGILAVRAADMAKAGKSRDEIIIMIHALREKSVLYFLVDTLEYLHKGGRIGKASALFGSLLSIKPILTIDMEGEVTSVDKVRGQKRAMARILELLKGADIADGEVEFILAHSQAMDTAQEFISLFKEHFRVKAFTVTTLGPVIGTHAGPGTIGIFMLPA